MKKRMNLLVVSFLLAGSFFSHPAFIHAGEQFSDVSQEHRFYSYIDELVHKEIISGFKDQTFKPETGVRRNEAAIMIGRHLDLNGNPSETSFSDVPKGVTGSGFIEAAVLAGVVSGYPDGTFRPQQHVTRGEMAIFLDRTFSLNQTAISFSDVDVEMRSYEAIRGLYGSGITEGFPDQTFRPDQPVTRGEFAAMMSRAMKWEATADQRELQDLTDDVTESILSLPDSPGMASFQKVAEIRRKLNHLALSGHPYEGDLRKFEEAEEKVKEERNVMLQPFIEDLETDFNSGQFRERTREFHRLFSMNQNQGDLERENETVFQKGREGHPVLITVPHGVEHIRNGQPKSAEVYTGPMGLLLHEYTDAHILYTAKTGRDANFYHDVEFKDQMRKIIDEHDISLVLDIHGMRNRDDVDISLDIGTNRGRIVPEELVHSLMFSYANMGFHNVWEDRLFTASNAANIAYYSYHELGVPAMQLEYVRSLRDPLFNGNEGFERFYLSVRSLGEFIIQYDLESRRD